MMIAQVKNKKQVIRLDNLSSKKVRLFCKMGGVYRLFSISKNKDTIKLLKRKGVKLKT